MSAGRVEGSSGGRNRSRGCDRGAPAPRPCTMVPASSIQTPFGTFTIPNSSSTTCPRSMSDGCAGAVCSMYGLGASASTSSANSATTSRPWGCSPREAPATRAGQTGNLTTTPRRPGAPSWAAERRQVERIAVDGRERELGRNRRGQRLPGHGRLRAEGPDPVLLVGHEGHAEPIGEHPHVDATVAGAGVVRQRHADVRLARPVVLHRPAGACAASASGSTTSSSSSIRRS